MDIELAKERFSEYVSKYDMNDDKINYKYHHSIRVSDICGDIAVSLKFDDKQIYIAKLIGLLHDIGRFDQIRIYNSYDDTKEFDHGSIATSILTDEFLKDYVDNNNYNDIIRKSIEAHNKACIPESYADLELLFSKIVRDADKLDIFYYLALKSTNYKVDTVKISDKVKKSFFNKQVILHKDVKTSLDKLIINLAYVFDINFKYSYNVLSREKYIDKIIDGLNVKISDAYINLINSIIDSRKED